MSQQNLMAVKAELVKDVLVGRIMDEILERQSHEFSPAVAELLDGGEGLTSGEERPEVTAWLTRAGYLTRVAEAELFEPARRLTPGLLDGMRGRFIESGSWKEAVAGLSRKLASDEPLERPAPDDERASSWRVPGPGGHVRHFVARQCIEHALHGKPELEGDPAELKRTWTYGFLVCCCEEALPAEASLESVESGEGSPD